MREENSKKMTIIEHLEELRRRIIICLVFFLIASIISFIFVDRLAYILKLPAEGLIKDFIFLTPTEVFVSYLRIALLSGFIISIPFILIQFGLFFMPAIAIDKRRYISVWLLASFLLSLIGIVFSYFLAIPFTLKFLINFSEDIALPMISIARYFSFASSFLLMGAGIFQLPVIIGLLANIGILNTHFLCKNRKYAIIIIFIIAAVITPTQDIINMLIFSLPMIVLYEIGILVAWLVERRRGRAVE